MKDKNGLMKTIQSLKYFNFQMIDEQSITENTLYYCCRYGYFPFVQKLLKNENIDLNLKEKIVIKRETWNTIEQTPIDVAIDKENIEIVKLLLSNDYININLSSCKNKERGKLKYERTPLLAAVDIENLEIVQLLLSNSKYK